MALTEMDEGRKRPPAGTGSGRDTVVTVAIHERGSGTGTAVALATGESISFGGPCTCRGHDHGIHFSPDRLAPLWARVSVRIDHWRLSNLGSIRLLAESAERPQEYFGIDPGRADVPVPFELTRITGACCGAGPEIMVFGFEPGYADRPEARHSAAAARVVGHLLLDRRSTYFAVLLALCEPRLRRGPGSALPSSSQIAGSLRRLGIDVTARAVEAHVDYLLDKLHARPTAMETAGRRSWKREAVVTEAIRRGLVDPSDLFTVVEHWCRPDGSRRKVGTPAPPNT